MPSDVRFPEIERRLEENGWRLTRIRGSHHVFTREGFPPISIPVHAGKVKHVYKRKVEQAILEARGGSRDNLGKGPRAEG